MNIVLVTINQDHAAIASWLAAQDFSGCTLAHWQIEPQPMIAEQVLAMNWLPDWPGVYMAPVSAR